MPVVVSLDTSRQVTTSTDPLSGLVAGGRWQQAMIDQATVRGFALLSNGAGIDSIPLDGNACTSLLLTGVESATELHIVNASRFAASITIDLHSTDGSLSGSYALRLDAKAGWFRPATGIFSNAPPNLRGYIVITST